MIEKTLSDSAFLVNESRARDENLSQDTYAKLWVDDAVRTLWERFSTEVYAEDPRALAVRNRFFLENINRFARAHPRGVIINIAAGFTSYPYLMDSPLTTVEVDLPRVVDYKRAKVSEFISMGLMPRRDVSYLTANINDPRERAALFERLREIAGDRPSFILLEGITYYLNPEAFFAFLAAAGKFQGPGSRISMDYWEPGVNQNRIFQKFCDFLERRCGHPNQSYNLLTPDKMAALDGYAVDVATDVSAYERTIAPDTVLHNWEERLPENFLVLVRT